MAERVNVGRVSGVYGVRGWLRVRSDCEPPEQILAYSPWLLGIGGTWQRHELETGKPHGSGVVAKLASIDHREQAEALVGADIAVARDQLPDLEDDEYYWNDLVGLGVVTREGRELGRVSGLMQTGANDVLVVQGERQRLIPFIRGQVIVRVDTGARRIEVDWDPDF